VTDVGGEVRLGSMLFTLVEPHPGREVAYNRWYERDHFYAGCMVGPWLFAGRRFVATRALKDLRFGTDADLFGGADLGSYLAVYWILEGRHEDHVDWALRQVQWLHANGRMFGERDHIHTLLYRHEWTARGAGNGAVPAELALDHPFGGLTATLVRPAAGVTATALGDYVRDRFSPELELGFSPIPLPPDAPVSQQGHDRLDGCLLNLSFTAAAPDTWWDEQRTAAAALAGDGIGDMLWTAPFIPTIPGTDTYTDQLW
jgi:hypothetical protein